VGGIGDPAIQREAELEGEEGPFPKHVAGERRDQRGGFVGAGADIDPDAGLAQQAQSAPGMLGIGIDRADDDARDARAEDGIGAGRGAPEGGARLQRDN
jgi:hypothetical protein